LIYVALNRNDRTSECYSHWYDPDRNPWKRLAESDFEILQALVRGKTAIRVTFMPKGGPWSIGELRALSHMVRPIGEATGKGK